jgi:hypothetical protein
MGQSQPIGTSDAHSEDSVAVISQINEMDDPRDAFRAVEAAISDCEARGETVPVELLKARQVASIECLQQSQGR